MNPIKTKISIALNAFGVIAVVSAVLCLAGSFAVDSDIGRAFCLGAFFSGLIGSILLFGFAKVIELLEAIRVQTGSEPETSPTLASVTDQER